MAKTAASEELLGKLHSKVATIMLKAVEQIGNDQEAYDAAKEQATSDAIDELVMERPELSPSLMSAITKFLSDNKITCNPEDSKELGELEQRLQMKRKRKSIGNVVPLIPEDD